MCACDALLTGSDGLSLPAGRRRDGRTQAQGSVAVVPKADSEGGAAAATGGRKEGGMEGREKEAHPTLVPSRALHLRWLPLDFSAIFVAEMGNMKQFMVHRLVRADEVRVFAAASVVQCSSRASPLPSKVE